MASQSNQTPININMEYLCQYWIDSYEEQQRPDGEEIYRPQGFKVFEPSRRRGAYIFHKNGDCEWLCTAPDDHLYFESGQWRVDPNDKSVLQIEQYFATKHFITLTYRVVELTKDILRMVLLHYVKAA